MHKRPNNTVRQHVLFGQPFNRPPAEWRRRTGRPRRTWLCPVEWTSAAIQHGDVHKIVGNAKKSWRQLRCPKGMPPDDDDDDDDDNHDNN